MKTKIAGHTVVACGLGLAGLAAPAPAQNVGSLRDAGKGAVDYRRPVAEAKEACTALGRSCRRSKARG